MKYYTLVGSRATPQYHIGNMWKLGWQFAKKGYTLRSGAADGADKAGEQGCDDAGGLKEIFLPWKGFNGSKSEFYTIPLKAFEIAEAIHPAWHQLSEAAKRLHARNCMQVLGMSLDSPSEFLVCWTNKGEHVGGTRTAIVFAKQHNIPVFNLYFETAIEDLMAFIETGVLKCPTNSK